MADQKPTESSSEQFICPECGKTFSRAAALGSHRRRAHGIAGSSKSASTVRRASRGGRRKTATAAASSATKTSSTARETSSTAPKRRRSSTPKPTAKRAGGRRRSGVTADGQLDRNQLLRILFPSGVPPREDVLSDVNSWLDEGTRLARLR